MLCTTLGYREADGTAPVNGSESVSIEYCIDGFGSMKTDFELLLKSSGDYEGPRRRMLTDKLTRLQYSAKAIANAINAGTLARMSAQQMLEMQEQNVRDLLEADPQFQQNTRMVQEAISALRECKSLKH